MGDPILGVESHELDVLGHLEPRVPLVVHGEVAIEQRVPAHARHQRGRGRRNMIGLAAAGPSLVVTGLGHRVGSVGCDTDSPTTLGGRRG
jgi:hypothetical protein